MAEFGCQHTPELTQAMISAGIQVWVGLTPKAHGACGNLGQESPDHGPEALVHVINTPSSSICCNEASASPVEVAVTSPANKIATS